jgi:hypothetical protein
MGTIGSSLPERQILLNDCRFNIRENLWQALNQLRREEEERVLWIDALCINQTNILERNHQVAQISSIYSSCSRCVAWIGTGPTFGVNETEMNDEIVMSFIRRHSFDLNAPPNYTDTMARGERTFDHFEIFCQKAYWNRLWIVQELLM